MTIKPVIAPTQKRAGGSTAADTEKKEPHAHAHTHTAHGGQSVLVDQSSNHSRNVVIDGHAQSPQRRGEVYDELARHRRSPHKSSRSKRREHHDLLKRDRSEREKHPTVSTAVGSKCSSPHVLGHGVSASGVVNSGGSSPVRVGGTSPEHLGGIPVVLNCQSPQSQSTVNHATANLLKAVEDTYSGYNSGDEHLQPKEGALTVEEWKLRDEQFAKSMADRGYILRSVEEDGACLFRAISLQIYGDEEMHDVIRQHTMDYIYKNREYFCHFVTEDINSYIKRKRRKDSHGNHIEIQAMSEIYSRPVEVYCYKPTPINIFNSEQLNNGYAPLRLSYQRGSHYNAIIDPYNATVGVGLGLAGYKPEMPAIDAVRLSEQLEIEQTMFEDKLKTTDWEATNEVIEEQIARESYLQWCRENLQKSRAATAATTSATVTSAAMAADNVTAAPSNYSLPSCLSNNSTATAAATSATSMALHTTAATSTLSAFAHNFKKDASGCDMGFESDDTDMSSTSSISGSAAVGAIGGNISPTSAKKPKIRGSAIRNTKKRRREHQHTGNVAKLSLSDVAKEMDGGMRKSPKRDDKQRGHTPEVDQPCTSKQSSTPEKQECSNSQGATTLPSSNKPLTSFYQDLLEASYAADGYGQLSESEMLKRAIQMSTQDYIEEQKRKYFYGP